MGVTPKQKGSEWKTIPTQIRKMIRLICLHRPDIHNSSLGSRGLGSSLLLDSIFQWDSLGVERQY